MATTAKVQHICCLGSSFAAGPGIAPTIDGPTRRSGQNYAHQLARRLGCRLTDVSSSGSTTEHIDRVAQFSGGLMQIESVERDCDWVFITTGGNDIGYVGSMMTDALRATWIGWTLFMIVRWFLPIPKGDELTETELAQRLGRIADAVHVKAPQAKVVFVEYLCLLSANEERAKREIGLTQIDLHKRRADVLRNAYTLAVEARSPWCGVVKMHDQSAPYAVGGEREETEAWVTGFSLYDVTILKKVPFHPTLAGMTATANEIFDYMRL